MGGCEEATAAPAVLVSKESGLAFKELLASGKVDVDLAAHPAVARAQPLRDQVKGLADLPLSCVYGPDLRYVTRTLPVKFLSAANKLFVPQQTKLYPPVLPSPCAPCRSARDAVRDQTRRPIDPPS